ncbi:MAG: thiamine phosphate synthase [Pseudolabrys sp.]
MSSRSKSSRPKQAEPKPQPRLYLVTPQVEDTAAFAPLLSDALAAGDIAAVLLRFGDVNERTQTTIAKTLGAIAQERGVALLLDGHDELVGRAGADGAHVAGLADFTEAIARLKPERIAGAGGMTSRHDAMTAAELGADYIMFGEPEPSGERPAFRPSRNASRGGPKCSRRPASLMRQVLTRWSRW